MILITGIAGFIGGATAKRFKKDGHKVIGLDNFNDYYDPEIKRRRSKELESLGIEVIDMDIRNNLDNALLNKKISAIIHIAASAGVRPSIDNPGGFVENNIKSTVNVLEYARKHNIKNIVFASSSSVYGNIISNIEKPIKESDIQNDIYSPYAATKISCEMFNHTYSNLYGMNIANLRYFTVYGPDQRPDLAIMKFIKSALREDSIDKYGEGDSFRDYTYIDDVVEANVKAYNWCKTREKAMCDTFNISSSNPITLNKLINLISERTGKQIKINKLDMQAGDVEGTFGDNSKAKELLEWSPKTDIIDGVQKTINWVLSENK